MRQEFIYPNQMPSTHEQYLRSDFDFAEYLSRAQLGLVADVFHLSWTTFIILMMLIATWRFVVWVEGLTMIIVFAAVPIVLLITLFFVTHKLIKIYYNLVPYVEYPNEFVIPRGHY
jgi:hypothetical protein